MTVKMKIYTIWSEAGEYWGCALSLTHAGKLIERHTKKPVDSGNLARAAKGERNPQAGVILEVHEHPANLPITSQDLALWKAEGQRRIKQRKKA